MALQPAIAELLAIPGLQLSDDEPQVLIDRCVALFDQISPPISVSDARAMVELLSRSDDDLFEAKWSLLHAIEAFPEWPDWKILSSCQGWWCDLLKQRCANAGLKPPQG